MRTPPSAKPAAIVRRPNPLSDDFPLVLITRLFGGGARARAIDPICWLRSAAAKSALRAWWRAGRAQDFKTLEALRQREQEIFGAPGAYDPAGRPIDGPGALQVEVRGKKPNLTTAYTGGAADPLNFALFSAAKNNRKRVAAASLALPENTKPAILTLTADLHSAKPAEAIYGEILDALRLWVTLGGVGSRTRRGVGALAIATAQEARKHGFPTTEDELKGFLTEHCLGQAVAPSLAGIFCLARTRQVYLGRPDPDAEQAQRSLLRALRLARQERRPPKLRQSAWPEADAIRLKAGRVWEAHPPLDENAGLYPRAVLGLPIVVHFKDEFPIDPKDHHVLAVADGQKLERYASPILLRPVKVFDGPQGSPRYVPVAVFTDCTLPPEARPLVVEDPKAPPSPRDTVATYDFAAHADDTFRRIEKYFVDAGLKPLFERK